MSKFRTEKGVDIEVMIKKFASNLDELQNSIKKF